MVLVMGEGEAAAVLAPVFVFGGVGVVNVAASVTVLIINSYLQGV